jgi:uncharacterized RDD family membrane protein YckC
MSSAFVSAGLSGPTREILTPEGLPLHLELAQAGDRIAGFLYDTLIQVGVMLAVVLLLVLAFSSTGLDDDGHPLLQAAAILFFYLLRNFYFVFFEIRRQGSTPGKRIAKTRVIARDGGALTPGMVFARNLTRDVELFLPLTAILDPALLFGAAPGWARLGATLWLFIFLLFPLFNADRLRMGDLIAGTMVVKRPTAVLLPDLSTRPTSPFGWAAAQKVPPADYQFTREQLDVYGIAELQVLEDVLRRHDTMPQDEALHLIAEQIKRKINWDKDRWAIPAEPFLRAFYAAQRARLEQELAFGRRREHKRWG